MTKQPLLFDAPGSPYKSAPLAANADPETSHEAAERHASSGKMGTNAAIALALVQRHPGKTYHELWHLATDAEKRVLGDHIELMRRLGGLKSCVPAVLRHGEARLCQIKGTRMVVWEVV